jgi:glycosyltransferase involved in cell wall biosynthesis
LKASGKPASPLDPITRLHGTRRPDLIYSPGYAAFLSPVTQVLTVHDLIHLETRGSGRLKYTLYYEQIVRPVIRRAGLVLTVSETSAAAIREWLDRPDVVVASTGNACATEFTATGETNTIEHQYLLFVGNMRRHKNAGVAFRVAQRMKDLRLRVLVPAAEATAARAMAERHNIAHRVDILTNLSDAELAREYRGAVATVMPSSQEGFGLPALESVCCGTPVVHWSGCRAISEASLRTGVAVDELEDIEAWVKAVESAPAIDQSEVEAARPSWDSVASTVEHHLAKLFP